MKNIKPHLTFAGLLVGIATVSLAACGGGGSSATSNMLPGTTSSGSAAGSSPATGTGSGTTTQSAGAHVVFSYSLAARAPGAASRSAAGSRAPNFVDAFNVKGLQLTVSSGTPSRTLYYSVTSSNPNCTTLPPSDTMTCTLSIPTLGATETISAYELDAAPTGTITNGQGTGFPTGSGILAVGSTTATLTGGTTTIPLSMNPVVRGFGQVGINVLSGAAGLDTTTDSAFPGAQGPRIVVTSGVPATGYLNVNDGDADAFVPAPVSTPAAGFVGQPFVDVDGTSKALTVQASSSSFSFYVEPGANPRPSPGAYGITASVPNSSVNYANSTQGYMILAFSYNGANTPSTLTLNNNLTATPPAFGGGLAAGPSTATYTYSIAPISVAPATLTFSIATPTAQTVTASDPGATTNMTPSTCTSGGGATIATVASAGNIAGGSQGFTVTPVAQGSCTFTLKDTPSNVPTNAVSVTVGP